MKAAVVLDKRRPDNDGLYPLYFRIYHQRYYYERFSINDKPISLLPKHWVKNKVKSGPGGHPNAALLNMAIDQAMIDFDRIIFENTYITPKKALELLFKKDQDSFMDYYREQQKLKPSPFTRDTYDRYINKFMKYLNGHDVSFKEITAAFINEYANWLKLEGIAQTTIHSHLRTFRAVYCTKVPRRLEKNPFNYVKWDVGKSQKRSAWTPDEVKAFENVPLKEYSHKWNARNVWIFSLQEHGMRISDLLQLRHENVRDGRLVYKMQKSKKDKAPILTEKAMQIIKQYNDQSHYIFPFLPADYDKLDPEIKVEQMKQAGTTINRALRQIAKLAGIEKRISTHVARNSVANELRKKGTGTSLISEVLGHSEEATTKLYLDSWEIEEQDKATTDLF